MHIASCIFWHTQETSAAKLPPPLVASSEVGKEPPKEVALLQDEETLFLDEETLPAEVFYSELLSFMLRAGCVESDPHCGF